MESEKYPHDVCRKAREKRDARYDGIGFSGAVSTKIYCRTVCPGKPPLASKNVYFRTEAEAEAAGYRPCLRCRPETAPGYFIRNADDWTVRRIVESVHQWIPSEESFDVLAGKLKTLAEPVRSRFLDTVGASPEDYLRTHRSLFAKMLLTDTDLGMDEIAAITGFSDAKILTETLEGTYHQDPNSLRKPISVEKFDGLHSCALKLFYRPPFDWSGLLGYFNKRGIPGVERVSGDMYRRSFSLKGCSGWFSVEDDPGAGALRLKVHASDLGCLMHLVWRVRRMFDLDADPMELEAMFGGDALLGPVFSKNPGIRVPVGWDAFEFAVRAVVGQQVSVVAATTVMGRIAAAFSNGPAVHEESGVERTFPVPEVLVEADLTRLGLTRAKASTISGLAGAVIEGGIDLEKTTVLNTFIENCTALRGIGDWTAQTIAMRGLGDPDAFPAGDLGIVKALSDGEKRLKPKEIYEIAERWRPRRAYAAVLLWSML